MKNKLLVDEDSDENETVSWIEETIILYKKYYNCGCCDNCSCDDNIECSLCGCQCNCDEDIEDEYDYEGSETEEIENNANSMVSNFNIMIIEDDRKEKKVRITLEINVVLSIKKSKLISVNLDISRSTYLKIAEELFN